MDRYFRTKKVKMPFRGSEIELETEDFGRISEYWHYIKFGSVGVIAAASLACVARHIWGDGELQLVDHQEVPFADELLEESGEEIAVPERYPVTTSETRTHVVEVNLEPVNERYVEQIIRIESSGRANAVSSRGARGLMQIMPDTWREETRRLYGSELDFDRAFDPQTNRQVGTNYLRVVERYLSARIGGWDTMSVEERQDLIAAAYNGGMGRLVRNSGDISRMPSETRGYVDRLRNLRER